MRRRLYGTIAFLFFYQISFGQIDSLTLPSPADSAKPKIGAIQGRVSAKVDSLSNPIKDGLKNSILTDTIASINRHLDSIQYNLNSKVDNITHSYTKVLTKIQSSAEHYQRKIDSLQSLKLPTDEYKAKMDSLSQKLTSVQQDLSNRIEGIKQKATEKIKSIQYPPELEDKVSKLTNSIGNLNIKTIEARLPVNLNLDKLNDLKNSLPLNGLQNLTNVDVPGLPKVNGLDQNDLVPEIKTEIKDIKGLNEVSNVNGQAVAVQEKVNAATKDLNPNSIDKLAESRASQLKEVKALQETSTQLPLNPAKSEEEMMAQLKEQARKVAVDHFAGKEEQLKAAMQKMSKYKTKYSSIKNISEITKKPPNAMKGKAFIERIVPGIGIQMHKKGDDLMVDFNPYVGYRVTGRITAGPGWNQRVAYNMDHRLFSPGARIFGPRLFGEFKLGKGFSPRAEVEVMNTKIPPSTITPAIDPESREWVWGAFVGIKKEYKIFKRVKGTAYVMTRLFDPNHKSPYADVLNVRFGFEFPMKKKLKK